MLTEAEGVPPPGFHALLPKVPALVFSYWQRLYIFTSVRRGQKPACCSAQREGNKRGASNRGCRDALCGTFAASLRGSLKAGDGGCSL